MPAWACGWHTRRSEKSTSSVPSQRAQGPFPLALGHVLQQRENPPGVGRAGVDMAGLSLNVAHVVDRILDDKAPVSSGEHARHAIEIMNQCYVAAREGRTQELYARRGCITLCLPPAPPTPPTSPAVPRRLYPSAARMFVRDPKLLLRVRRRDGTRAVGPCFRTWRPFTERHLPGGFASPACTAPGGSHYRPQGGPDRGPRQAGDAAGNVR